jgi:hypothetical protein
MTRVFDLDGSEKDLNWMAQQYDGAAVLQADTTGATEVWRLAAIYVIEGPPLLKAEVRSKANLPVGNQPVVMTYPRLNDPNISLELLTTYATRWADRGVVHRTNAEGLFGFGLGTTYGPFYHTWVLSSAPSDCLTRTGMKGGTEHRGPLHPVWVLQDVEPEHATLRDALIWNGQKNQVIQFNPSAALQRRIFAANFVPNSPEFDLTYRDVAYVVQRSEHLGTGEVRIYYVRRGHWNEVSYVTL